MLYRYDGVSWSLILAEELQYLRKVVFDPSGAAWLLAPPGIFRIQDDQLLQESDISIDFNTITTDPSGQVWFLVNADDQLQLLTMREQPLPDP